MIYKSSCPQLLSTVLSVLDPFEHQIIPHDIKWFTLHLVNFWKLQSNHVESFSIIWLASIPTSHWVNSLVFQSYELHYITTTHTTSILLH